MKTYWRFLKSVFLHKWYVLIAGRRLRVPLWRLLVHDLSKLTATEFGPYARHFYGDKRSDSDPDFDRAWHFHKLRNAHHWERWVSVEGNVKMWLENLPLVIPGVNPIPMPMIYVREMVSDWFAAGRAYNGAWPDPTNYVWYKANRHRMHLHGTTEMRVGLILAEAARWEWK